MKKLLFLIHDLGGGGAEKVLVNLVNRLDREKYEITVVSLFAGGENEKFLKPDVRRYSVWNKTIPGNSKLMKMLSPQQLHKICIKEKYDIEISFLEGPSARIISGCENSGTKKITWIHTQGLTEKNISKSFRSKKEAIECYHSFNKVVCVSKSVEKNFMKIAGEDIDTMTLYNVIDNDDILSKSKESSTDIPFSDKEFNIIGVGKITPNKGFDRLARIHRRLRAEGCLSHVYILGIGAEEKNIQKYLNKYGLSSTYTFLGYQSNPYKYLRAADLYVCSSFIEGFSTAAVEALMVGTPVCTVEVSGMRELLGDDNEWGIITENTEFALYEGIKKLMGEQDLLNLYAGKAKERGDAFGPNETVKAVEELLDSI